VLLSVSQSQTFSEAVVDLKNGTGIKDRDSHRSFCSFNVQVSRLIHIPTGVESVMYKKLYTRDLLGEIQMSNKLSTTSNDKIRNWQLYSICLHVTPLQNMDV
jgi:hypothetical protein